MLGLRSMRGVSLQMLHSLGSARGRLELQQLAPGRWLLDFRSRHAGVCKHLSQPPTHLAIPGEEEDSRGPSHAT